MHILDTTHQAFAMPYEEFYNYSHVQPLSHACQEHCAIVICNLVTW